MSRHPGVEGQNHLSMAILSMAALGATAEQITYWGERFLLKRRPFPEIAGPPVTEANWQRLLGRMEALPGFRALFASEVARRGVAETLHRFLPPLLEGPGTAEFHSMIRTSYGVRFGDSDEVKMGLAHWCARFGAPGSPEVFFRRAPAETGTPSLETMAAAMVRNYIASNDDILALHGVTGTHAYRLVEPFVRDRGRARGRMWQALTSYVGLRSTKVSIPDPARSLPAWDAIALKAVSLGGDHHPKLTDTAREEFHRYGDSAYAHAAALRVKLL